MKLIPIFSGIRKYWLLTLIGVGVSIAIANIASVMLLKSLWQSDSFTDLVFGFAAIGILVFTLSIAEGYCAEKLGQNYVKAIRCQLYQGLVGAPSYLAPKRVGVVMSRLITDSNQIKNWASIGIPKLTIHTISVIGLLAFLCINWNQLGGLAASLCTLYLLSLALLTPKMYQLALEIRRDRGRLSGFLGETIIASRTVNQFNLLNRETRRLARHSDRLANSSVKQLLFSAASGHFSQLIAQVMTLCVLVLFLWENTLPNQELAVVMMTLGLLFHSLKQLNTSWGYAITFYAAKVRLELALSNATPDQPEKQTRLAAKRAHAIQLKDLQLSEGSEPMNHTIQAGAVVRLSPSDAAERLVNILTKQDVPVSGRVTISGRRLEWLTAQSVNKSIVVINRSSHLVRGTVHSNLKSTQRDEAQLQRLCEHFELPKEAMNQAINELGSNLPHHLKALLLVIKALLRQPGALLLSHPEIDASPLLMEKLLAWQQKQGFTLIVAGHYLEHQPSNTQRIEIQ